MWRIGRIKKAVIGRETFELKLSLQDAPRTHVIEKIKMSLKTRRGCLVGPKLRIPENTE